MSRLAIFLGLWPGALVLCLLAGCGPGGPVRYEIKGNVTLNNQPLDEGIIDFFPLDGQGSKSGATVRNGEYVIPRDKGLFPGRYKVTLIGGDSPPSGGKVEAPGPRPAPNWGKKDRIPPEYNERSNKIVEVKPEGPNQFDFNIP